MANKIEFLDEAMPGVFVYACPACGVDHCVYTQFKNEIGAIWKWNGSMDKPTFMPSADGKTITDGGKIVWRCHHYIENGTIRYLSDCTHAMKGTTVDLPDRK